MTIHLFDVGKADSEWVVSSRASEDMNSAPIGLMSQSKQEYRR